MCFNTEYEKEEHLNPWEGLLYVAVVFILYPDNVSGDEAHCVSLADIPAMSFCVLPHTLREASSFSLGEVFKLCVLLELQLYNYSHAELICILIILFTYLPDSGKKKSELSVQAT